MSEYFSKSYDDKRRWVSYWHQITEVLSFNPNRILVIGKGNGLVAEYLKLAGIRAITLDIDESLKPDIVASVLNMPIADKSFDVVLCAQVLEHLPYDKFPKALSEIKRVAKIGAVISLPHFGPAIRFLFKLPILPEIKFMIKLPYPKDHRFKGEHHWEIGKRGYPLKKVKREITQTGFIIENNYIIFENPLHRFFILKK